MTVMIMMGIYGTNKCHIHVTLIRFMKDDDDYDNDQKKLTCTRNIIVIHGDCRITYMSSGVSYW